jgi:hypothetical protein
MASHSFQMVLPGERIFLILCTSPEVVASRVNEFLEGIVPAHSCGSQLDTDGQTILVAATVFIEFVPISLEVSIRVDDDDEGASTVVFKHPSQSDIVRFRHVTDRLIMFLQSVGLQLRMQSLATIGWFPCILDDDFNDDCDSICADVLDDEVHSCAAYGDLLQLDMESPSAIVREEAIRNLARWAATTPASHAAVAKICVESHLEALLVAGSNAPLAEVYPAASALKHVTGGISEEAWKIITSSQLWPTLEKLDSTEFPPVVGKELAIASKSLRLWNAFSQKLPAYTGEGGFSSGSTRCTDTICGDDICNDCKTSDDGVATPRMPWIASLGCPSQDLWDSEDRIVMGFPTKSHYRMKR